MFERTWNSLSPYEQRDIRSREAAEAECRVDELQRELRNAKATIRRLRAKLAASS